MAEPAFKLTPELALDIVKRRRWAILVPLCFALIIGIFLAFALPKVYEAKTLILVESQRVPQNFVQPIVTEDTAQRINTISQQILSRTNLEKIIKDFGLFSKSDQGPRYMEDMVANLRKRISVDVSTDQRRQTEAFTISFRDRDPDLVMRVANGLATYFIDANLKVRESQAVGTSNFLESEMESMRQKLEKLEENIKNYRKAHMGELPEQLDSNLRILARLQDDLNDRQKSLRDAKLRLAELNSQAANKEPSVVVIGGPQRPDQGTASLEDLKSQLESLRSRYTEQHPDIQRLKRQIVELEAKAKKEGNASVSSRIPPELRRQIADAQREIEVGGAEIDNIRGQVAVYQKRVEDIPKREQELLSLKRDYDNIKTTYDSLLNRKLEADIAVNMERKQKGEQFRIVDPAVVPKHPIAPNLKKLFLLVILGGFGAGVGLALLLEFSKPAFRTPDEIESRYDLPVLVTIPRLLQPKQIFLGKLNNIASIAFSVFALGLLGVLGVLSIIGTDVAVKAFTKLMGG
jgi:polysaccharide chain length determinant protein (PEP-CTERM system associated)